MEEGGLGLASCSTVALALAPLRGGGCWWLKEALLARACILAWKSALKVNISYCMVLIPALTNCVFVLLDIYIVLITSVVVVMLSFLSSDSSYMFVMVPVTLTPLPEVSRFVYTSSKWDFIFPQSWLGAVNALHPFRCDWNIPHFSIAVCALLAIRSIVHSGGYLVARINISLGPLK